MKTNKDWVIKARARHHDALKSMMPADSALSGLAVWRKLRRLEGEASRMAVGLCNGDIDYDKADDITEQITHKVAAIFGRPIPGFFINRDPRGYALKLEPGSVPYPLVEDWGRYQILAPTVD